MPNVSIKSASSSAEMLPPPSCEVVCACQPSQSNSHRQHRVSAAADIALPPSRGGTNLVDQIEDFSVLLKLLLRQVLELRRKRLDFVRHSWSKLSLSALRRDT
tara:strand:+ start:531 stop:839 length:309 start_codon:yes stop_codon:yes gene_type:complete